MDEINIPRDINEDYYKKTIADNAEYYQYDQELQKNYELTFLCDEWLDIFCFQTPKTRNKVSVSVIKNHIEKYFGKEIPSNCLMLAIKHRNERHTEDTSGNVLKLFMDEKAYQEYLKTYG